MKKLPGVGGLTSIDFYIDYSTRDIKLESDIDETTIATSTRVEHLLSAITTPEGDTLDKYTNIQVNVEYYYSTDGEWHTSYDTIWVGSTVGIVGRLFDGDKIYIRSGPILWSGSALGSNTNDTGNTTARPCRAHITAIK